MVVSICFCNKRGGFVIRLITPVVKYTRAQLHGRSQLFVLGQRGGKQKARGQKTRAGTSLSEPSARHTQNVCFNEHFPPTSFPSTVKA